MKKYKASYQAAWANEIIYMCGRHMSGVVTIGAAIGAPINPIPYAGEEICKNCKREEEQCHAEGLEETKKES